MTNDNPFKEELRFLEKEGKRTLAKVIKQEQYMNKQIASCSKKSVLLF